MRVDLHWGWPYSNDMEIKVLLKHRKCALLGLLLILLPQSAVAQFGPFSIPSGSTSKASTSTDTGCKSPKKKRGAAIFGNVVGQVARNTVGRTGAGRFLPVSQFSSTLSEAIACRLDPTEQGKAAAATDSALRTEKVGKSAEWSSDTRTNVTGTSTVSSQTASASGGKCMIVTDVIIVDGEETRADKKMCRSPGEKRYVLTA